MAVGSLLGHWLYQLPAVRFRSSGDISGDCPGTVATIGDVFMHCS